jgi:hypothetical protein
MLMHAGKHRKNTRMSTVVYAKNHTGKIFYMVSDSWQQTFTVKRSKRGQFHINMYWMILSGTLRSLCDFRNVTML